jgi:hypothetical protein
MCFCFLLGTWLLYVFMTFQMPDGDRHTHTAQMVTSAGDSVMENWLVVRNIIFSHILEMS